AIIIVIVGFLLAIIFHIQNRQREFIRKKVQLRTRELTRARNELELVLATERKRTIQQYRIARFGQEFLSGFDEETLFSKAVNLVSEVLDTSFSAVFEHQPENNELFMKAGIGWKEEWLGSSIPDGNESQSGYTLLHNKPVLVVNNHKENRFEITEILKDHSIVSSMSVTIYGRDKPFGILIVCSDHEKKFSEDDIHFLEAVSNTVSAALLRVEIESELRESEEMLSDIIENQGEGIAIVDLEERFLFSNPSADKLFGVRRGGLIGKTVPEFLSEGEIDKLEKETAKRSKGIHSSYELKIIQSSGDELILLTTVSPRYDKDGNFIGSFGVFRDITARKLIERDLRDSEERFRDIVTSMADWIWETDTKGRYIYCSEKVENILGYHPQQMLGKSLTELIPNEEAKIISRKLEMIFKNREAIKNLENWNISRSGRRVCLLTNGVPVIDERGSLVGYRGVGTDITERKEAEARLKETNRKLQQLNADLKEKTRIAENMMLKAEKANRAKSDFLANMSHEIRTPMNGVVGMISLLLNTELTNEQIRYAETVQVSAESLMKLINNVLDFSKIEAGKLELEELDFDLREVMGEISEMVALKAQEKGLEFICYCDPEAPELLRGDPSRLKQILINLAGNAIKFTETGEIRVLAEAEYDSGSKITIRFSVRDTGIGISEEKVDLLFEKFSQVDASTTRKYGGSGLGLAISKQLVGAMGGLIGVKSEVGRGTEFWFSVPLEKNFQEKQGDGSIDQLTGESVLLVDDNSSSRNMVGRFLKHWGIRYEEAEGTEECLHKLSSSMKNNQPFSAVIIDKNLNGENGVQLGHTIKSYHENSPIPLLLMDTLDKVCNNHSHDSSYFSEILMKPLQPLKLFEALQRVCRGEGKSTVLDSDEAVCSQLKDDHPDCMILVVEDNIINQKVALGILKKLNFKADVVENGLDAVEALKSQYYNIVFMDIQMPVMDGYEATRLIRDPGSGVIDGSIPIIAMTANALKGDKEKCLEAGMDDYISKPVTADMVSRVLIRWLGNTEQESQKAREEVTS
ncbi:MAG: PAS domain S-box protein, partial [Candidatus Latescibacteria bacterium]|nr:PAS domain S-box protein [Candidatus Latescibacterota bacterium]